VEDRLFATSYIQNADVAVAAWKECVKGQSGVQAFLHELDDSQSFSIEVHFDPRTVDKSGALSDLILYSGDDGYECTVNGQKLHGYNITKDKAAGNPFFIQCHLTRDESAELIINTSSLDNGDGIRFKVAGKSYAEMQAQIETMQKNFDNRMSWVHR
jgi:hypothetical protein